jgi:hypothetical protein
MIGVWCAANKIPMIAMDIDYNEVHLHSPETRNKDAPSFVYRIHNKHIYPVLDKKIIESVCEKDAEGKPVIEEKDGVSQYKIINPEEFAKQYNELMDAEADVELFKFEEELLYKDDMFLTSIQSEVLLHLIK